MDALTGLVTRLEACASTLESLYGANKGSVATASNGPNSGDSPAVAAYGQALDGLLETYLSLSANIGGLVLEQVPCATNLESIRLKQRH